MAQTEQHTPGPWSYVRTPYGRGALREIYAPEPMGFIARVTTVNTKTAAQAEANARLIAAAPDLLKVAELALDFILYRQGNDAGETVTVADLRSAIARATGASS